MRGCGEKYHPPHNNFITLSQSLFCGVKVGPDPALNLNCLMFLNGSEQSCTTKLMLQQHSVSILLLIPCCIEVSHSDLVSLAGPINKRCPGVDPSQCGCVNVQWSCLVVLLLWEEEVE